MPPFFRKGLWRGIPILEFMDGAVPLAALTLRFDDPCPQDQVISMLRSLGPTLSLKQVHGDRILDEETIAEGDIEGDGVFLQREGVISTLQFADCYPVFLSCDSPCPWRLSLHSGFAGTTLNVVASAANFLKRQGVNDFSPVMAWVGPGIGRCCYSRRLDDSHTTRAMSVLDPHRYRVIPQLGEVYFDLAGIIKGQLTSAGIPDYNIAVADTCTACGETCCFSYRRGDIRDRMVLFSRVDHAIFVEKK